MLPTYHPTNYPGGIEAAEETQISTGEVVEETKNINFSSLNLTDAERRNEIENGNGNDWPGYNNYKTNLLNNKQTELAWTGYRADIT